MHELQSLCNREGKGDSTSRMSHSPHSCPRRIVVPKMEKGDRWPRELTPTESAGGHVTPGGLLRV